MAQVTAAKKYQTMRTSQRRLHERTFQSNGTKNGITYFVCSNKFTNGCVGTAKLVKGDEDLTLIQNHSTSCLPDGRDELYALKDFMVDALAEQYWEMHALWAECCKKFPIGSTLTTPEQEYSTFKKERLKVFPKSPDTWEELCAQIKNNEWDRIFKYNGQHRVTATVIEDRSSDKKKHIGICDEDLLKNYHSEVTTLRIDCTFYVRINLSECVQLLTVLGVYSGKFLCIYYALMTSKTTEAYQAIGEHLKSICPLARVEIVMSDFELAIRKGFGRVFLTARFVGCNTHFNRAVLRKCKALLPAQVRHHQNYNKTVLNLMALAFLPPNQIADDFDRIKMELEVEFRDAMARVLDYYERQWIGIVSPDGFSVYGLLVRTNNGPETHNSELKRDLGQRPPTGTFFTKITDQFVGNRRRITQLDNLLNCKTLGSYKSSVKSRKIKEAWRMLREGRDGYDSRAFLRQIRSIICMPHITLRQMAEDELDKEFVEIRRTPRNLVPPVEDVHFDQTILLNETEEREQRAINNARAQRQRNEEAAAAARGEDGEEDPPLVYDRDRRPRNYRGLNPPEQGRNARRRNAAPASGANAGQNARGRNNAAVAQAHPGRNPRDRTAPAAQADGGQNASETNPVPAVQANTGQNRGIRDAATAPQANAARNPSCRNTMRATQANAANAGQIRDLEPHDSEYEDDDEYLEQLASLPADGRRVQAPRASAGEPGVSLDNINHPDGVPPAFPDGGSHENPDEESTVDNADQRRDLEPHDSEYEDDDDYLEQLATHPAGGRGVNIPRGSAVESYVSLGNPDTSPSIPPDFPHSEIDEDSDSGLPEGNGPMGVDPITTSVISESSEDDSESSMGSTVENTPQKERNKAKKRPFRDTSMNLDVETSQERRDPAQALEALLRCIENEAADPSCEVEPPQQDLQQPSTTPKRSTALDIGISRPSNTKEFRDNQCRNTHRSPPRVFEDRSEIDGPPAKKVKIKSIKVVESSARVALHDVKNLRNGDAILHRPDEEDSASATGEGAAKKRKRKNRKPRPGNKVRKKNYLKCLEETASVTGQDEDESA